MAASSQDDAFREIQLSGKQLVFLFMAATVVSVVIFLCGVLVGRGVSAARTEAAEAMELTEGPTPAVASSMSSTEAPPPAPIVTADGDPRTAEAPPAVDDLTYFSRLEQPGEGVEELKPPAQESRRAGESRSAPPASAGAAAKSTRTAAEATRTAPAVTAPAKPAQTSRPAAPPQATAKPAAAPAVTKAPVAAPPAGDWAVQIAALNVQTEADAVAKRLAAKGYTTYVVTPGNGTPTVYRVRIGPFKTRREADVIALRLEKEEQIKPWVTR
jgi:cell division septation protein DedD